ncbi:MAG: hypothetical protein ACOC1F_12265, partial [Myxococcota bacterium]
MPLSRRRLLPLPLLFLVPGLATSCRTAGIKDAYTATDSAGRIRTSAFARDNTEIHMIVEFVSGRDDAVLIVELFVPEGSIAKFEELEIAPGKGEHLIDIKLVMENDQGQQDADGPWDVGFYEADLLIDC